MKVLFLGGDYRYLEILKYFNKNNYDISFVGYDLLGFDNLCDIESCISMFDIIIFPIEGIGNDFSIKSSFSNKPIFLNEDIIKKISNSATIFTGIKTKKMEELLSNILVIPLMNDNYIKEQNGALTAEGIIADIINNTKKSLSDSHTTILGYGNIGKPLSRYLSLFSNNVSIGVIEEKDFNSLYNAFYTSNKHILKTKVKNSDIIINTVPISIIDKEFLYEIKKEIYLLDVSSYPYGFDFELCSKLGINYKLFSGIPGKISPITAGKILTKRIESQLRRDKL